MLELASVGAKVLQTRSVGLAMKEKVRVQVLSSFLDEDGGSEPGTLIVGEEELDKMEQQLITGIAHDKNDAKITLTAVLDQPGSVAAIFRSEEHTSELQSLMRISYAVFCLKKKNKKNNNQ